MSCWMLCSVQFCASIMLWFSSAGVPAQVLMHVVIWYTPFGNSMRSLALLSLVGGKDFCKSVRAASSWCFGRHGLEHWWYVYQRSCRFGISLMCQFHWELDCVGFSPFEIWRCGCVEMMRGIGGAQRPMLICIILHWLLWLPECAASHCDLFSNRRCTDFPDWV